MGCFMLEEVADSLMDRVRDEIFGTAESDSIWDCVMEDFRLEDCVDMAAEGDPIELATDSLRPLVGDVSTFEGS